MDSRLISKANDPSPLTSQNSLAEATVPFTLRNMTHYSIEELLWRYGSKHQHFCIIERDLKSYCLAVTNDIITITETFTIKHCYFFNITPHTFKNASCRVTFSDRELQHRADHCKQLYKHVIPRQINRWTASDSKTTRMTIGEYQRPDLHRHVVNVVKRLQLQPSTLVSFRKSSFV